MTSDDLAIIGLVGTLWPSIRKAGGSMEWKDEHRRMFAEELRHIDRPQAEAAIREEYRINAGALKLMSRLVTRLRELRRQAKQRDEAEPTQREIDDDASPKRTVREFIAAVESGEVLLDERERNGFRWMKRAIAEEKRNRGSVSTKGVSR
jgi:hypothetical protein